MVHAGGDDGEVVRVRVVVAREDGLVSAEDLVLIRDEVAALRDQARAATV